MKKNNTAEKAALNAQKISEALKESTENSLKSLMNEAITNMIMEDDDNDEDDYDVEDVDTEETDSDEDACPKCGSKDCKDGSCDVDDACDDDDEWSDMEDYKVGDNNYDFTDAKDDEVLKVYNKLGDDDKIFVKKDEDGKYDLKDEETGAEYVIELNDADLDDEPEDDIDDEPDDTEIEVDLDDDDEPEDDDDIDIDVEGDDDEDPDDAEIEVDLDDDDDDRDELSESWFENNYQKDVMPGLNMDEPADSRTTNDWDGGAPRGNKRPYGKVGNGKPFKKNVNEDYLCEVELNEFGNVNFGGGIGVMGGTGGGGTVNAQSQKLPGSGDATQAPSVGNKESDPNEGFGSGALGGGLIGTAAGAGLAAACGGGAGSMAAAGAAGGMLGAGAGAMAGGADQANDTAKQVMTSESLYEGLGDMSLPGMPGGGGNQGGGGLPGMPGGGGGMPSIPGMSEDCDECGFDEACFDEDCDEGLGTTLLGGAAGAIGGGLLGGGVGAAAGGAGGALLGNMLGGDDDDSQGTSECMNENGVGHNARRKTSKTWGRVHNQGWKRNHSEDGEYKDGLTTESMYRIYNKARSIQNENKQYAKSLKAIKESLKQAMVCNVALGQVVKLLKENTTSRDEKEAIVQRFNNVKSINECKNLYKTIKNELNGNVKPSIMLEHKISAKPSNTLNETKMYNNRSNNAALDLMMRLDELKNNR